MLNINQIIAHERSLSAKKERTFKANIPFADAKRLFMAIADRMLTEKAKSYIVCDQNRRQIAEIIRWFIGDPQFSGDLNKGIWLAGDIGTGKTQIFDIMREFMQKYFGKIIRRYTAIEVVELYKTKPEGWKTIRTAPIFIDDIGTEDTQIKNYGTIERPIYDLLSNRYNTGHFLMFVTTNLEAPGIEMRYGNRILDRRNEMFNVIPMRGESFRKKSVIKQ